MTLHELKTWPSFFEPVWSGEKTFEVRYDDRGYQRGDQVVLREWDRDRPCGCDLKTTRHGRFCAKYTGRSVTARIGFVCASTPARGSQRGFVGNGYVVLSLVAPVLSHKNVPAATSPAAGTPSHPIESPAGSTTGAAESQPSGQPAAHPAEQPRPRSGEESPAVADATDRGAATPPGEDEHPRPTEHSQHTGPSPLELARITHHGRAW